MSKQIAIIIPSIDNRVYLEPCLRSIISESEEELYHIYVVNNGATGECGWAMRRQVTVLDAGANLGWERAIQLGVDYSTEPYTLFCNDDVFVPPASRGWLPQLLAPFADILVGAVGPSSNYVSGPQSIWQFVPVRSYRARMLIGFCLLVRRTALEAVGGIDCTLPGGDDLDLCIRLRAGGWDLVGERAVFVFHHGSVTGSRLHGGMDVPGGWNSAAMTQATMEALIAKHGPEAVNGLWSLGVEPWQPARLEKEQ